MRRDRGRRPRRKVCTFCVDKVEHIDYKDVAKLRRFITERGKTPYLRQLRKASAPGDGRHQARPQHRTAAVHGGVRRKRPLPRGGCQRS